MDEMKGYYILIFFVEAMNFVKIYNIQLTFSLWFGLIALGLTAEIYLIKDLLNVIRELAIYQKKKNGEVVKKMAEMKKHYIYLVLLVEIMNFIKIYNVPPTFSLGLGLIVLSVVIVIGFIMDLSNVIEGVLAIYQKKKNGEDEKNG